MFRGWAISDLPKSDALLGAQIWPHGSDSHTRQQEHRHHPVPSLPGSAPSQHPGNISVEQPAGAKCGSLGSRGASTQLRESWQVSL